MEITCERCHTEYDFDDALVSDQGTNVKCTQCGQLFRVYRQKAEGLLPDRWIVYPQSGGELHFGDLRELQRAILARTVTPYDAIRRGNGPPRAIGSIAELLPLFASQAADALPAVPSNGAPAPMGRARSPRDTNPGIAPELSALPEDPDSVTTIAPRNRTYDSAAARLPQEPRPAYQAVVPPGEFDDAEPTADPVTPRRSFPSGEPDDMWEPDEPRRVAGSGRAVRWVVSLLLLTSLGLAGLALQRNGSSFALARRDPQTDVEPRVERFLRDGEHALEEGDLESAREFFDKASALAEKSPRVLLDVAVLATVRADLPWLRLRLSEQASAEVVQQIQREQKESALRAKKAADAASTVSPDDPEVTVAKINALRQSGDLDGARALAGRLGSREQEPNVAYALGALSLEDAGAPVGRAVELLRRAAAAPKSFGRTRALLAYASSRAGDAATARTEMERLAGESFPYPLLPELKAFALHATDGAKKGQVPLPPASSIAAPPSAAVAPREESGRADYRLLMKQAIHARQLGRYAEAEQLFTAALAQNPGDTESLTGLGEVARARGNSSVARSYFERVLTANPDYVPAQAALADIKWNEGDRAGADVLYQQVADSSPQSTYGAHARERLSSPPATREARPRPRAKAAPAEPSEGTPQEIDTSDLPGFSR